MGNANVEQMPVVYVPHGGGPLPLMNDPSHQVLTDFLQRLPQKLPQPKAIVVISAHWEEPIVHISASASPGMLFDYYNFPPETYQYSYPAPGDPALAENIHTALNKAGIASTLDLDRGYDHGTFVPLMLMYPAANIPVVQVSLLASLDAKEHIKVGMALRFLRDQGILVLGSGMSFHNMRAFFSQDPSVLSRSQEFDDWLVESLSNIESTDERLAHWEVAPRARYSHPREEHLLPLMVCWGIASGNQNPPEIAFNEPLLGAEVSAVVWR
jgi:aromatic ring-opening dioxygenase catalytic subunit (LigB family)